MTHARFGRSRLHPSGTLTHTTLRLFPHPDDVLKNVVRPKILHYRRLYADRPDPIGFMSLVVSTSARLYDDFIILHFLHDRCGDVTLPREIPEESDHFRFLRADCWAHLNGSVGLISETTKPSVITTLSPNPSNIHVPKYQL